MIFFDALIFIKKLLAEPITIQEDFDLDIGYIQKILILLRKHFINDEMHNEYGAYTLIVIYVTITFTTKVVSVH